MSYLRRSLRRLYYKVVREKASPEYIARGWAIGMFFGCFSPFGAQLIFSIPCAFLLKGSKIGATFGTLLTNQFTIFFIYPLQCYVGSKLIGGNLSYHEIEVALKGVLEHQSFQELWKIGQELCIAFFTGGALLTAIMTPLTYFVVLRMIREYRARRAAAAARKKKNAEASSASKTPSGH
ncbi:MAG: DUF2062 domain-containing protein [Victivallaceae bacterium]|nr:DUF2062 domain-containing protein [Victivallaceae bacterium]